MPKILLLILSLIATGTVSSQTAGEAPVHDNALDEVRQLQTLPEALPSYPADGEKRPNWVELLRLRQIQPRETLRGGPRNPEPMGSAPEAGIVFRNTLGMPHVVFPHRPHTEWLACNNCHDVLFERRQTGRGLGMEAILAGRHCGVCHGRVAFSPEGSCYRCHSQAHPDMLIQDVPVKGTDPVDAQETAEAEESGWGSKKRRQAVDRGQRKPPVYPARPQ